MERYTFDADKIVTELIIDVEIHYNYQSKNIKALVDTGCNNTAIASQLARDMKLQIIGEKIMRDMQNKECNSPIYNVILSIGDIIHLPPVDVVEFPFETDDFELVLGMDVLSLCDFVVTNNSGHTKINIIYPSCIDFGFKE